MSGEEKCSAKLKSGEGEQEFDFCESFQSSGRKERKVISSVSMDFRLNKSIALGSDLSVYMPEI
jgi:hypothetical protein